jgi:type VI secretion system secreted protein VgrG
MEITTPLGDDVLLFHSMHAHEEIGRLTKMTLDLLSKDGEIGIDDILGKNVTVKVALKDDSPRYFNGYVVRFAQRGKLGRYHRYFAEVVPWLWFLTRTADCRIFQEMKVPDIVQKIFADHPTNDVKVELTGSYKTRTYCVQYRETDFNFVSRLLEEEGIAYYVRHTDGHNTVVLTDSLTGHDVEPGYEEIPFVPPGEHIRPEVEHISSWEFQREVQPGVYVHTDYDFERPSVGLQAKKTHPQGYTPSDYEVFDYPGFYMQKGDGEASASVRVDEYATLYETAEGVSNARGICAGALFKLTDYKREDQNREYLITATTLDLQFGDYEGMPPEESVARFQCIFTAMPSQQPFRPRRVTPKPFVQGPQTAVVVGPGGDEIYTDKYGRIKVKFHWDRAEEKNENSSCWVRVSHPWAGKAWGAVATPRIGQEVVVDFLEGDPDQPIVTGRVYNAEQMPPYELPANMTQSGIVSRSSPGGSADNFNELMFEDKKGSELVYLRAEKDYTKAVENDEVVWVGHDKWTEIDNDDTTTVGHDRTETVDNDETITIHGNRTETVDKDETIEIKGNRTETVKKSESLTVTMQRTHTVGINETITIGGAQETTIALAQAFTVGGKQSTSIGGTQSTSVAGSRTVKAGKSQAVTVNDDASMQIGKNEERKVKENRATDIGKDDSLTVKKNLKIDAGDSILIKTGKASISMKKDGTIVIEGKDVTLKGSGKIQIDASKDIVMKGSKIKQN